MDEARFLRLISRSDPTPDERAMRGMLHLAAGFYALIVRTRNLLFDRGWKNSYSVGTPIVSIGNLTTGGTGKTPLVAYLVEWFQQHGLKPGIVSRGYRAVGPVNDEKLVLDRLCPEARHVQNRDRVSAARQLLAEQQVDVIIADDAFQHRRLKRDLDVVLIDALNPWGHGYLLPRGLLREPRQSLLRAGVVILTRADQVDQTTRQTIWDEVKRWRPETLPVEVAFEPQSLKCRANQIQLGGTDHSTTPTGRSAELASLKAFVFCGIGNPAAFEATLQKAGVTIVGSRMFPDHHHYSARDLAELQQAADRTGATAFIATLKDVVKLPSETIGDRTVWSLDIAANVLIGSEVLSAALRTLSRGG